MTIHVPKWAVWTLGGLAFVAVIAVAFVVGRSSGDDGDDESVAEAGTTSTTTAEPAVVEAPCTQQAAKEATLDSEFDEAIVETAAVRNAMSGYTAPEQPVTFKKLGGYRIAILECEDLTGDDVDEMIVALSAGASGSIFQWAIFEPNAEGEWELAFHREGSQVRSINAESGKVAVKVPIYEKNAPTCCPSGSRLTTFVYEHGAVVPDPAPRRTERLIRVEDEAVVDLSGLDASTASGVRAAQAFSKPTSISNYDDALCAYQWSDLGLTINFVNFGGLDPCGPDGRVGSVELVGTPAEQAGWQTSDGAHVGMSLSELREQNPGLTKANGQYVLAEKSVPFGDTGVQTSVGARVANGEVLALQLYVGAGGE